MSNFIQLLPRLFVAVLAGIVLFFFLTIGFILALGVAIVFFVIALIFMRKNKIRFGNTKAYIFTNRTHNFPNTSTHSPPSDTPYIDLTAHNSSDKSTLSSETTAEASSETTAKTSQDSPCIDLDPNDYHGQDRKTP